MKNITTKSSIQYLEEVGQEITPLTKKTIKVSPLDEQSNIRPILLLCEATIPEFKQMHVNQAISITTQICFLISYISIT